MAERLDLLFYCYSDNRHYDFVSGSDVYSTYCFCFISYSWAFVLGIVFEHWHCLYASSFALAVTVNTVVLDNARAQLWLWICFSPFHIRFFYNSYFHEFSPKHNHFWNLKQVITKNIIDMGVNTTFGSKINHKKK